MDESTHESPRFAVPEKMLDLTGERAARLRERGGLLLWKLGNLVLLIGNVCCTSADFDC